MGSVAKLQKVQNALYHFVFKLEKMSHAKPYLEKLHWLPISYSVQIQCPYFQSQFCMVKLGFASAS